LETIYQKYRPAHEILIEYYAYCELRKFIREDWEKEDNKWNNQCNKLWSEYEESSAKERDREENSKSAKIAKKLETMKLTEELVTKIKLRNRDK
jgi:hypothetical protein